MSKIRKNDLLKLKFLSNLGVSKSERYISLCISESTKDQKGYKDDIYLYDMSDSCWSKYTDSGNNSKFFWDKELDRIYIYSLKNDKDKQSRNDGYESTTVYRLDIGKGEPVEHFSVPKNIENLKQISENKFIFTSYSYIHLPDLYTLDEFKSKKQIELIKSEQDYEVIESIPFWENGSEFTHNKVMKLYIYDLKKDKLDCISDIADKDMTIQNFELNEDKDKLVIIYYLKSGKTELTNSIMLIDIEENKVLYNLKHSELNFTEAFINSSNKIIALATDMKKYGINENSKFYTIDPYTKTIQCMNENMDLSVYNSVGSDIRLYGSSSVKHINNRMYFVGTVGFSSKVFSMDHKGNIEKLTDHTGSVDDFTVIGKEIFFCGLRQMKPQELYKASVEVEQISEFNSLFVQKKDIVFPEHFTLTDEKGMSLDYWIVKPSGYKKGKKYPAILDIHGGPKTVYGEVYYHEMQVWASEGFAVIFCNPRGSDGKGNDFADIRGKYGDTDYQNIMDCLDAALEKNDYIDEDNLFVTGGSYGGFMTNWIIGHTDRFKAAATQRSISNWTTMYATSDIGYYFAIDQTGADPFIEYEKMWNQSPMKNYNKIQTPTLIIHSDRDYRCNIIEAYQLFTSLKFQEIESRLVIFKNENHELTRSGRPDHRLRSLDEITNWFKSHIN